jgi:hypothetical protein
MIAFMFAFSEEEIAKVDAWGERRDAKKDGR